MKHRGANGAKSHTQQQYPEIWGNTREWYKNDAKRQADENESPCLITIGQITNCRLDDESK